MTNKPDAFRFANSILTTKEYQDGVETEYNPFFNNKILSQHVDCIMHVNAMNMNHHLTPRMQYDYYYHSIRKMKRKFHTWAKRPDDETVKLISTYYKFSLAKAREVVDLFTKEQLERMRDERDIGG